MKRLELHEMVVERSDGARLVDRASLTVEPGEVHGLVGESGSGKTLLSFSALGLLPDGVRQTSGAVRLDGQPVPLARLPSLRGSTLAMVMQEPLSALNPVLTVGAQLIEVFVHVARLRRDAAERAAIALLDQVGIPEPQARLRAYPHQLSGGMRQRVLIAAALAAGPQILIADEPTTALDVSIQAQILELLDRERKARGMSLLLISHDLALIGRWCDRVSVIYSGRVVEVGPAAAVLAQPRHPYGAALIAARPDPAQTGLLPAIPGTAPQPDRRPTGCRFRDRCPRADHACTVEPELSAGPHPVACHHPLGAG